MPPPPFSSPHNQPAFPALYLYPLNDTFVPKHISLIGGQRVKIGRQTNAKTVPAERNGYFDSKVLSRQHAEVWEESGKVRLSDSIHPALHFSSPRSSSKTSRAQTVPSSTANVSVPKASSPNLLNSKTMISWYEVFHFPHLFFTRAALRNLVSTLLARTTRPQSTTRSPLACSACSRKKTYKMPPG